MALLYFPCFVYYNIVMDSYSYFKGLVHPQMKTLSAFIHAHTLTLDVLSSVEHHVEFLSHNEI